MEHVELVPSDLDGIAGPETQAQIAVRTEPSFIRLIYSFALEPSGGDANPTPAGEVLSHLKGRAKLGGWEDRKIHYDYVLPHLADHMNAQDERHSEAEVGHWWRFGKSLPSAWTVRVSSTRQVELALNGIEFIFFRTGIGMLVLEITPESVSLEDWHDVLHLTRFYRFPPSQEGPSESNSEKRSVFGRRAPRLTPATDNVAYGSGVQQLQSKHGYGFGLLIAGLLNELFGDRSWERASVPGLLTPYSAFFVDCKGADSRLRFEALYRWRRQLQSGSTVAALDHEDLHAELRPYADRMWLAYSSEGGGFFAADSPRVHFFEHELPDHLRRPYAFGYLLALHQRLALSRFSERIARVVATSRGQWTSAEPPRDEIALLQDDFLEYLTRCHFAQVLRTTNHHANYKTWEEVLEVPAFAQEVELQLRHLYERTVIADRIIDEKRRKGLSGRVNAAVLGIALPTVVLAILTVAYPSGLPLALAIVLTGSSAIVGTTIGWLTATYIPVSGRARNRTVLETTRETG